MDFNGNEWTFDEDQGETWKEMGVDDFLDLFLDDHSAFLEGSMNASHDVHVANNVLEARA